MSGFQDKVKLESVPNVKAQDSIHQNSKNETWKQIPSFLDYSISNVGRVKRDTPSFPIGASPGRFSRPYLNNTGYLSANLTNRNGQHKAVSIHRLMVEAFIGHIPPTLHVNHKDGCKLHNCLHNLELITPQENDKHASKLHLKPYGTRIKWHRLNEEKVIEIRNAFHAPHRGLRSKLAKKFSVAPGTIDWVRHNKSWRHVT